MEILSIFILENLSLKYLETVEQNSSNSLLFYIIIFVRTTKSNQMRNRMMEYSLI